tara:strand:- start:1207 stop:2058 length:852 start_codon:yes stop_codon:yes gene_type:complete
MKIRKSLLKKIIQEEVTNAKFINVREDSEEPSIIAPGLGDFGQDAIAVLKQTREFIDKMIEEDQVYGNLVDSSIARLQGIAKFHKELQTRMNEDNFFDTSTETAEAAEQEAEDDTAPVDESSRLLDEIIVQEIIKILGEGPLSHTHQARALQKKAKEQGALGHNDAAALKYHLAQSEKEKAALGEKANWGGNKGDQNRSAKRGEKSLDGAEDFEPVFEEKDDDWMGDVKSTGEWTDYTVAELEKKKATLMKKEKRTADEVKTVRQLNFAIRAKKGELSEEERT